MIIIFVALKLLVQSKKKSFILIILKTETNMQLS